MSGRTRERGFTLVLALVAFTLASAVIAWSLSRLNIRAVASQTQVNTYRSHHDALSYRDIASVWLQKVNQAPAWDVAALSASPGPHYVVQLPTGVTLELYLRDAQGRLMTNLANIRTPDQAERMIEVLGRIPSDRGDLVRTFGPTPVSLFAADDVLLDAIAGGDARVAGSLIRVRDEGLQQGESVLSALTREGIATADATRVSSMLTARASIFAVDMRALPPDEPGGVARRDRVEFYSVEIENDGDVRAVPLAWRRMTAEEFGQYHGEP